MNTNLLSPADFEMTLHDARFHGNATTQMECVQSVIDHEQNLRAENATLRTLFLKLFTKGPGAIENAEDAIKIKELFPDIK